jgi:hypothetical protein
LEQFLGSGAGLSATMWILIPESGSGSRDPSVDVVRARQVTSRQSFSCSRRTWRWIPSDVLLEFYKYSAEHWFHLRTTKPDRIDVCEVRLWTNVTKGPGSSRAAGIAMAYKLIDAAQARWRAVNAPHLVALVRAGAGFHKGKLLERPTDITPRRARRINRNGGRLK